MDDQTKRVAVALCRELKGEVKNPHGYDQCKACRQAAYGPDDQWIDLGPGCLGFGYERIAEAAIAAMNPPS